MVASVIECARCGATLTDFDAHGVATCGYCKAISRLPARPPKVNIDSLAQRVAERLRLPGRKQAAHPPIDVPGTKAPPRINSWEPPPPEPKSWESSVARRPRSSNRTMFWWSFAILCAANIAPLFYVVDWTGKVAPGRAFVHHESLEKSTGASVKSTSPNKTATTTPAKSETNSCAIIDFTHGLSLALEEDSRAAPIHRVIQRHQRRIRACTRRDPGVSPGVDSKALGWHLNPRGRVTKVLWLRHPLTTRGAKRCVTRRIRSMRFPTLQIPDEGLGVNYIFEL